MALTQPLDDPQVGNVATPINASGFTKALINNLPAYRQGLSPNRRGLEVGMAHGYFLYGPFALLGPLRDTEMGDLAGLVAAVSLVTILTIALSLHAAVRTGNATETLTTPLPPAEFGTKEGWSEFASGFLIGGCGGAAFAYFLATTPLLQAFLTR
ncbi:MAG: photosystem I reaction center protein subunit XI [Gloeocapsa sp. DLM2.Bin57]|nr:MAG: photosystem I reaction center protein subunit XI [Gloeocapsa sp. DLM2.Bin57]